MNKKSVFFSIFFSISLFVYSQTTATYNIVFNSIWNPSDHTSVPTNAHWSKLVGATHKSPNIFFRLGQTASTGIKNIAEIGNNQVFNNEVNAEIDNNEANQYIDGPYLSSGTGNITINNLQVDQEYPLLTLVSMVAPSPDWFIGINSYNLLDDQNQWKTSVILDVFAFDAGTDSGTDYTSINMVTNPFEPISQLDTPPINGNKMGTISIILNSVLTTDTENIVKSVSIYPNPSNGIFTISTPYNNDIKNISVFNILGKKIATSNRSLNQQYDFSYLKKGVYILKITLESHKTKTQKLVIK